MLSIRTSPRAIICRNDHYLVVHYRDATGDWYVFPGGGQHHGEDLHQALTREVEEEIGVKPRIGKLRFVRECIEARLHDSNLPAGFHQLELFFDCEIDGDPLPAGMTPDANQVAVEWKTVAELRDLRFFPRPMLGLLEAPGTKYIGAC